MWKIFIKGLFVIFFYFPLFQHRGFYFPPPANKDRAVNSMEIKDFIILWTYSQWRQALVVIPPFLSREGNVLHAFLRANIQELTFHQTNCCGSPQTIRWVRRSDRKPLGAFFQTERTQNICMLSLIPTLRILLSTTSQQRPGCQYYWNERFLKVMDLQPMTTSYCRHSPSLSIEGNVLHDSVNQLLHACSLLRGKSATCYRYSQALTYSNLLSTIR